MKISARSSAATKYLRAGVALPALFVVMVATACARRTPPASRIIDLAAHDGTPLKATYFGAAQPGPGVLLLHQCNRQRKMWDDLAARLASAGMNVLTLDYRGFGESGGPRENQISLEQSMKDQVDTWPGDVDVAFDFLRAQPGVKGDVIGAAGASCGVNQSVELARRHPEVKALVLLSGGTFRSGRRFLQQAHQLPLLAAAADDDGGAVDTMNWLISLSPHARDRVEHYPTGGHGIELFAVHPELAGTIVEWLGTNLLKSPNLPAPPVTAPANPSPVLAWLDEPGGTAKVRQKIAEASPGTVPVSEGGINQMGYELLMTGDRKSAIELFELAVMAFPRSANAHDSFSDAYLADGQNDRARQHAENPQRQDSCRIH